MRKCFLTVLIFLLTGFLPCYSAEPQPQQELITQTLDNIEQIKGESDLYNDVTTESIPSEIIQDNSRLSGLGIEPLIDSIDLEDEHLSTALDIIALKTGLDIIYDASVKGKVTLSLKNVEVWDLLRIILDLNGMRFVQRDGVVRVMPVREWEEMNDSRDMWDYHAAIFKMANGRPVDVIAEAEKIPGRKGKIYRDAYHRSVVVLDTEVMIKKINELVRRFDVPVSTENFPIPQGEDLVKLKSSIASLISNGVGRFEIDENSRTLTVTDIEKNMALIRDMVVKLKRPSKIKMNLKIIGILLNEEHHDGVDWEAIVSQFQNLKLRGSLRNHDSREGINSSIGLLSDEDIKVLMEALDTVGTITVFLEGKVEIESEDINRIAFDWHNLFETKVEETQQMNAMVMDVKLVPAGVGLKLSLDASLAPVMTGEYFQDTTPSFHFVKTPEEFSNSPSVVEVGPKETIVVGGIMESVALDHEKRLPLLGQIPLVGPVFFATQTQKTYNVETVIFLTPELISGEGDM